MSKLNGTGPDGKGLKTGRGLGKCEKTAILLLNKLQRQFAAFFCEPFFFFTKSFYTQFPRQP
jgi:hypothetical protein